MDSYTNISIFGYDLIVQKLKKPFEVRIAIKKEGKLLPSFETDSMPSNDELKKILNYLGEEGFLDDFGMDGEQITWMDSENRMRLAVGYLPSHKFKQLKYKLEQHG